MSKGSNRRPAQVPRATLDEAWARTFGGTACRCRVCRFLSATPSDAFERTWQANVRRAITAGADPHEPSTVDVTRPAIPDSMIYDEAPTDG